MDSSAAAALLRQQDDILIITHKRPDGDTIGCAIGLCVALRAQGKTTWLCPNRDATALFLPYLQGYVAPADFAPRFVVSTDIAGRTLFTPEGERWLERGIDLAIDHHPSYEGFARESCVDAGCAACGELVYDICCQLGEITPEIALPLYLAVSTDTGCFMYGNTTAGTHRVAAALMETGIDTTQLNKRHFHTKSLKRLKIEGLIVEGMEQHDGGKITLAAIPLSMMAALDAREEDVEDISAFVGQVEGVETSVTIRELQGGGCKLSVRTGGSLNATRVCARLGGGGHAAAAGCTVSGTVEEAKAAIMTAIRAVQAEDHRNK